MCCLSFLLQQRDDRSPMYTQPQVNKILHHMKNVGGDILIMSFIMLTCYTVDYKFCFSQRAGRKLVYTPLVSGNSGRIRSITKAGLTTLTL